MDLKAKICFLAALAVFYANNVAAWRTHSSSSSLYIHSNDTFTVTLSDNSVLSGTPGSRHTLQFIVKSNVYGLSRYTASLESENNFRGRLSRDMITLNGGQLETITVTDLVIPQGAKNGMEMLLSLVVRKEDNFRRKKRQVGGSSQSGGSGYGGSNVGGSSQGGGYNPGGGSYNPGGSSQSGGSNVGGSSQGGGYNPGGGSYNPGGSSQSGGNYGGNGGYNPGGSSQSGGNYGGNGGYNPDNGLNWNNDPGYNDPSNKREVRATVVFKVTDEMVEDEDDTEPWTKIEYGAESDDETCTNGPGEPGCDLEYWWVKFRIQDEDSGLHLIDVKPGGKETYQNQVYYRYTNFPIGTTKEQEVVAAASCCLEGLRLRVTDVSGEVAEAHAIWDETGSGLSATAIYAIIGACAAVVLIIVVVVAVVLCKKYRYDAVSQNP